MLTKLGMNKDTCDLIATQALCNLDYQEIQAGNQIISALQDKVLSNSIRLEGREKSSAAVQTLSLCQDRLLQILHDPQTDRDTKRLALIEIWRTKDSGKTEGLIKSLKDIVAADDRVLSPVALGELFMIMDNRDPFLSQALSAEISHTDINDATIDDVFRLIFMAQWSENPIFIEFLKDLKKKNLFPESQQKYEFDHDIDDAIRQLEKEK